MSQALVVRALFLFSGLALAACSDSAPDDPSRAAAATAVALRPLDTLADAPLPAAHAQLLDLAFRAAARMPDVPHRKNRSRQQALLVRACLEFDQPKLALARAESVDGWERGLCLAEIAAHCVEHGLGVDVAPLLVRARTIAEESMQSESAQAWRRDRILATAAAVDLAQGRAEAVPAVEQALVEAERVRLAEAAAETAPASRYPELLARIDADLAGSNMDLAAGALQSAVTLLARNADDAARRSELVDRIANGFPKLPLHKRVELLLDAAGELVRGGAPAAAIPLLDVADRTVAGRPWMPEDQVALRARIAGQRARCGQVDVARRELEAALDVFHAERDRIADVFRGEALRPLAEAFAAAGDLESAGRVYRRIVEEGVANPNSKPRAEDLGKTCVSMVRSGFLPPADLLQRLEAICGSLRDPW